MFNSRMNMLSEYIFKARTSHRLAVGVDEEFRNGNLATHSQPCPQVCGSLLPER